MTVRMSLIYWFVMVAAAFRAAAAGEDTGLKFEIHSDLPLCPGPDPAKCGQPDIAGYLPLHFCSHDEIRALCPAMCHDCLASQCISHDGEKYELGQKWETRYGCFSCSNHGVLYEQPQDGPVKCGQMDTEAILGQGRQERHPSEFDGVHERRKRDAQECPLHYSVISPDHSRCLHPPHREQEGINDWHIRQKIVNVHNQKRSTVGNSDDGQPVPTNMLRTTWDWELAKTAQKWARNCIYMHDESFNRHVAGRFPVGQNIAKTSYQDWDVAMNLWWDEIKDFTYGVGSTNGKPVGHYTQMAWASSTRIGCGYALCNETDHFYVCDYGPAGNKAKKDDAMALYKPYNIGGARGVECPATLSAGLCDCLGKACRNGGSLDPNSCQCDCLNKPWIEQEPASTLCKLECSNAKDIPPCESMGGTMSHDQCLDIYNIGYDMCPIMCKWCPQPDGEYWQPGNLLVESSEGSIEEDSQEPENHEVDESLPDCTAPDMAKCGQPDSGGYWPKHYCMYSEVESSCPAMCDKCKGSSCVSHDGVTYQVGEQWVTPFGRFTCYADGVDQEQGCNKDGHFVASESSYIYEEGFTHWTCTCEPNGQGGHRLSCWGA